MTITQENSNDEVSCAAVTHDADARISYETPVFDEEAGETPLKTLIDGIIDMSMNAHRKNNLVIEAVCEDLNRRADLYFESATAPGYSPRLYLRMKETGEIIDLFQATHLDDLLTGAGLQLKTSLIKTVAEHVCLNVRQTGNPVKVCIGSHYDADAAALYVSLDPRKALKITPTSVDLVSNVVDSLLLLPCGEALDVDIEAIQKSELGMKVEPGSLMHDYFEATYSGETLSPEHARQLLCTRILALFFPEYFTARSMLILDGEPGSGKTILAKKIGWLMHGSQFEVSLLSRQSGDLETLLSSDPLVVLDNLDEPKLIRRCTSLLCQAVTGGKINKRKLYTTNTKLSYPLVASLVCTSIDLGWVRSTIADRALIIELAPRPKDGQSTPEINFKSEAVKLRSALMTEVLGRCRNILIALSDQAGYNPEHILRLHDFAGFMLRCAVQEGWADEAREILNAVATAQHQEADVNNPLHDVIRQYVGRFPLDAREHLTATNLGTRLKQAADALHLNANFEWGPFGMRGLLHKQFSSLRSKFGLCREKDAHLNAHVYWFEPTAAQLDECKRFARQADPTTFTFPTEAVA